MEVKEVRDFPTLIPEWERLFPLCAAPTPFLTWQWVSTWWKCFGEGEEPLLLTLGNGSDGLVAIAPLYAESGELRAIGSEDLCDYQDFVVMRGKERTSLRLLLSYVQESYGLPLYLHSLPAFSPLFQLLREEGGSSASPREERGSRDGVPVVYRESFQDTTPVIHLPSSFEEYLGSLSQKQRHEIRRKLRRIEGSGKVGFLREESAGRIGDFITLHKNSPEKAGFMNSARERFFREVAELFSQEGWLELFFLKLDDQEIASLLCFGLRDTLYLYNSGYNSEYSSLSPGIVILSLAIEDAIRRRFKRFNLLKGSEKYKYDFGAEDLELYEVCIE